jgi:D-alanyl-D-alanine carboxypeptidase
MMSRHLAVLAVCFGLSAQQSPTLESKLAPKIADALKKSGAPSVSVAVVEDGKLVYAHAFGMADLAASKPASLDTRYAVGSVSKEFTAAAILKLQEEGKLSLDDKVAKYFPNLRRAGDITIRQLLSHTSGYEDYAPQDYIIPEWTEPISPAAILDRWAMKPLTFEPGTKWQYSNTGYVLAGSIFEKVSGQSLVAYLEANIFKPLGMSSAGDWRIGDPANAVPYTRFAVGPPRPVKREAGHWYFAAGELAMTPSDLAKWDIAFLEKKLLSARSYADFTREIVLQNGNRTHYALGLSVGELNGIPMLSHGGEVSGFLSSNAIFPTRNAAVVVLSNQDGVNVGSQVARQIAAALLLPDQPEGKAKDTASVRRILDGLRMGKIDRGVFTPNANSYFTAEAIRDIKTSLGRLGRLKQVTFGAENLRGGMIHRSYRAEFDKKTLSLNLYLTNDGKFEQFLIME